VLARNMGWSDGLELI